jgi:copper oxidase (laccase) domain-containing protein
MKVETYSPNSEIPYKVILPKQCHGIKIIEIITGNEDLSECDGVWTKNKDLILGVQTSDCAPICFSDRDKFGIIHVGWRGLVNGICENILNIFNSSETDIFVAPMLPEFEIKKDFCYEAINKKFGTKFFVEKDDKIIFKFKDVISSILPNAKFDPRSTYKDTQLSSWRRKIETDKNPLKSNNTTVVMY